MAKEPLIFQRHRCGPPRGWVWLFVKGNTKTRRVLRSHHGFWEILVWQFYKIVEKIIDTCFYSQNWFSKCFSIPKMMKLFGNVFLFLVLFPFTPYTITIGNNNTLTHHDRCDHPSKLNQNQRHLTHHKTTPYHLECTQQNPLIAKKKKRNPDL